MIPRFLLLVLVGASLAGCGKRESDLDKLDRDLIGNAGNASDQTDPALTAALEDQIMVDPALAQQANDHSVRPADAPVQAPVPPGLEPGGDAGAADRPTLGELAQAQGQRRTGPPGCYADLAYSHAWANRLPAGLPLVRDAAVDEAAGNDLPGCRTRVVSYATAATLGPLIRFYVNSARHAGYAADHSIRGGDNIVAGDRLDGSAFYLTVTPRDGGGSDVDIVANNGR